MAVGSGAHPTVLVVAGIHGDEYEGGEAARRVCAELDPARMDGTVIAVLVANPLALHARTRTTPPELDGLDLARTFPGDPKGTPTQQLAHALWTFIEGQVAGHGVVADLHSGGAHYAYARLAGYRMTGGPAEQRSRDLAQALEFPKLWAMDPTPGALSTHASLRGITSIACEVTGGATLREGDIVAYEQALYKLFGASRVLRGDSAPSIHQVPGRTTTVTVPEDGLALQLPNLGRHVSKGQELAVMTDALGASYRVIAAPHDGEVWAARTCPALQAGDIMALVSEPASRIKEGSNVERDRVGVRQADVDGGQ